MEACYLATSIDTMADSDGSGDSDSERSRSWRTERRGDTGDDVAKVAAGVQAGSGGRGTSASGGGRGGNSRRGRDSNIDHDRSRSRYAQINLCVVRCNISNLKRRQCFHLPVHPSVLLRLPHSSDETISIIATGKETATANVAANVNGLTKTP